MALAYVTFINYYPYEVEVDDELYDNDPYAAEEQAIEDARVQYEAFKQRPIPDISYDAVKVDLIK